MVDLWFAQVLRDGFVLAALGQSASFADIAHHSLRTLAPDLEEEAVTGFVSAFTKLPLHRRRRPRAAGAGAGRDAAGDPEQRVRLGRGLPAAARRRPRPGRAGAQRRDRGGWKPAPAAYQVALDATGVEPQQAAMVAVHPWDLHGAAAAGMRTIWVNRRAASYPDFFAAPDLTVSSFEQLASELVTDLLHIVKRYVHTVAQ